MAPPTPPGVPAPFVYMGGTSSAEGASTKVKIGGGDTVIPGNKLAVDNPGNQPANPTPKKDMVTSVVNQKVLVS
jgi:hypothetical protein